MEIRHCRAKSKTTGKWVYGYPIEIWTPQTEKQKYAVTCSEYDPEEGHILAEEIDPNTVQFYTGQKANVLDSNGEVCHGHEVYEGDILERFGKTGNVFFDDDYGWCWNSVEKKLSEINVSNFNTFIVFNILDKKQ